MKGQAIQSILDFSGRIILVVNYLFGANRFIK